MELASWTQLLEQLHCPYRRDVPMADYTSFRIGGPADLMIEPETEDQVAAVVRHAGETGTPLVVLGNGSNLLVADRGIRGAVLHFGRGFSEILRTGEVSLQCEAGAQLASVCKRALDLSLGGMEFAWGIPGSVGGAALMNAGAYGGEMKDVLVRCRHLLPDGTVGERAGGDLELAYRHSAYSDSGEIILTVEVRLVPRETEQIRARMEELMGRRREKQPLEWPSAGSTFKRPEGAYAAALIEQCGLKGERVGGAMVSDKHSGFIINTGGATASDVLALIDRVKERVYTQTGFELECEVRMVGF